MNVYIVQKGDSLYTLAQRFCIDIRTLAYMNPHIGDPTELDAGTRVNIPQAMDSMPSPYQWHASQPMCFFPQANAPIGMNPYSYYPGMPHAPINPYITNAPVHPSHVYPNMIPDYQNVPVQPTTPVKPNEAIQPNTQVKPNEAIQPNKPVKPNAVIQPTTPVKPNTAIQPNTQVKPNAAIQPNTQVKPNTAVKPKSKTKPNTIINPHSTID